MDFVSLVPILAVLVVILLRRRRRRLGNRRKRIWVRPWLLRRNQYGAYETLMQELQAEDRPGYRSFQRMYPEVFKQLLQKVTPLIQKKNTRMRMAIPPAVRLALTLRYLATGNFFIFFLKN